IADLIGMEAFEQVKRYLDRCFAGEDVSSAEWFSAPNRQYLAMSFSPLRPDSSRVDAALVISRDLTDHMLASDALRQAQADLAHISRVTTMGELTASLAHEINQPIAAAVTNANACLRWLARADPDVEEAREAAARMVKSGTRAADIINRIRLLFRKGATPRESVDVNEVIQEMIVLLRTEATRYAVPIRAELGAGLPKVKADRVQLQQVLMNLMLNGIDAMKDAKATGELTIRSEQAATGQLLISVSDAGVRAAIEGLLKSVGLRSECFATPQEFLSRQHPNGPSCLVLDVRLPGVSGLEVQHQLTEMGVHVPVIFITGHGDIPMTVRAM